MTTGEIRRTPLDNAVVGQFLDAYKIDCAVKLPPSTIINRGCSLRTLLTAIERPQRAGAHFYPPDLGKVIEALRELTRLAQASHDAWKRAPDGSELARAEYLQAMALLGSRFAMVKALIEHVETIDV